MTADELGIVIRGMAPVVRELMTAAVAPIEVRLTALETRTPIRGERGEKGDPGEPGASGLPGPAGEPGRDGRDGLPGVPGSPGEKGMDGKDGINGKDGVDGLGFDDLDLVDRDGLIYLQIARGDNVKSWRLPTLTDAGVWRPDTRYLKGQGASFGGSFFIAQCDTTAKPETNGDWRLAVKRGRDGKDGKAGEKGEPGRDVLGLRRSG